MTSKLAHNQILHETLVSRVTIETYLKNKHMSDGSWRDSSGSKAN